MEIQIQVIKQNEGNFSINQQMNKENIYQKEYSDLNNTMKDLAEWICIKNAVRYLWQPINNSIKIKLSKYYQKCIDENKELEKKFNEYALKAFNEIGNNLKNLKV